MYIRRISITFLYLLCIAIVAFFIYYKNISNTTIYDSYVNKTISKYVEKYFPGVQVTISNTKVSGDSDDYSVNLSGILIQETSGKLLATIPKIQAHVQAKYFFTKFIINSIFIENPQIIAIPNTILDHDIKKIISNVGEYIHKVTINNLVIKKLHINEINLQSNFRHNKIINLNIRKDQESSIQIEAKVIDNAEIAVKFSHIDLSLLHLLPKQYINAPFFISGLSTFQVHQGMKIDSAKINVTNITGQIKGKKTITPITQGGIKATIKNNLLSINDFLVNTGNNQKISLAGSYNIANHLADIDLNFSNVEINEILDKWPQGLAPKSLEWVQDHITAGNFHKFTANITGNLFQGPKLNINTDFTEGEFSLNELFAPITNMQGHLLIQDNSLKISCNQAKVGEIELTNGTVTTREIGHEPITIQGNSHSALKDLYPLLDENDNLKFLENTDGIADVVFDFTINDKQVGRDLIIKLSDVNDNNFYNTFNIQQGIINININNNKWRVDGHALANDQPFSFTSNNSTDFIQSYLTGTFAISDILKIGSLNTDSITGNANVDIAINHVDNYNYINGKIDIENTVINLDNVGWYSKRGDKGILKFNAIQHDSSFMISEFNLDSNQANIKGKVSANGNKITELVLHEFSARDNHIMCNYTYTNNIHHLYLKADKLMLNNMINHDVKHIGNFEAKAQIGELLLHNDIPILDLNVNIKPDYQDSIITGKFSDTEDFIIQNEKDKLTIKSDNAGLMLSALDITDDIAEGTLFLYANKVESEPYKGKIIIKDFFLIRASVLTKILSLASLQGIVNTLNDDGVYFNQLQAPFTFQDNIINFSESWFEGLSLGISFQGPINISTKHVNINGHVVPIYYINKLIWKVPVIGKLLTAGKGRGVISIDYHLETQENGENKTSVNMMSAFTPKILQRILEFFQYH